MTGKPSKTGTKRKLPSTENSAHFQGGPALSGLCESQQQLVGGLLLDSPRASKRSKNIKGDFQQQQQQQAQGGVNNASSGGSIGNSNKGKSSYVTMSRKPQLRLDTAAVETSFGALTEPLASPTLTMITPRNAGPNNHGNTGIVQQQSVSNGNMNGGGGGAHSPLPSPSSADFLTTFGLPGFMSPSGQHIHPHQFSPSGGNNMPTLVSIGGSNNNNGLGSNNEMGYSQFLPLLSTTNANGSFNFQIPATPLSACTTPLGSQSFTNMFGGVNSLMNGLLGQPSPGGNVSNQSPKREAGPGTAYPSALLPGMGAEHGTTPRTGKEDQKKKGKKSKKDVAVDSVKVNNNTKKKRPPLLTGVSQERQNRQYTMLRKRSACHYCSEIGANCGLVAGKCPNRPCTSCNGRHRHGRCRLKRPLPGNKATLNAARPSTAGGAAIAGTVS